MSVKENTATNTLPAVVVIGGGWSGLSCAVSLAANNIPVLLLESARQLGGRARGVKLKHFLLHPPEQRVDAGYYSDNGHHIMLGAYRYVLELLKLLSINEQDVLLRKPLELILYAEGQKKYSLKAPRVPAPLHLIFALLRTNGFKLSERIKALNMLIRLAATHYTLTQDISVKELMHRYSQTPQLLKGLWEPLCLAALNTPIDKASAQVFLLVLRDSFSRYRSDSDVLLFKTSLSHFLPLPASDFIQQHGGKIRLASRVSRLQIINKQISQVIVDNECLPVSQIVLATPADITHQLLASSNLSELVPDLEYEPICSVYLQYPEAVRLPALMCGFIDATSHWAFEHSVIHQTGSENIKNACNACVIAIVISGPGRHMLQDNHSLARQVHAELAQIVKQLPEFIQFQVIREKKATFSCQVNIQNYRPGCVTPIKGLYLAGDYTDTGHPATLEGAVKSGFIAAQNLIDAGIQSLPQNS